MPAFKIHRIRDSHFEHFRWSPHTAGPAQVKPRDYEAGGEVEAASVYAAWSALRETDRALRIGDLLESVDGALHICKYVGIEEAHWVVPEPKPGEEGSLPGAAPEGTPLGNTPAAQ